MPIRLEKLVSYQINRFVDLSYDQFYGRLISEKWCHITHFEDFFNFLEYFFGGHASYWS